MLIKTVVTPEELLRIQQYLFSDRNLIRASQFTEGVCTLRALFRQAKSTCRFIKGQGATLRPLRLIKADSVAVSVENQKYNHLLVLEMCDELEGLRSGSWDKLMEAGAPIKLPISPDILLGLLEVVA